MLIFVGLGNPGSTYAANRHNIGFMALDQIASDHGFGPWREKFSGLFSIGQIGETKVLLLKPMTYMNKSGSSVQAAASFYKVAPGSITVFHDELDLPPGKMRSKFSGGHAGHNGLRSIHQHIGADYHRIRLGIGHPGDKSKVANYVLNDFAKSEEAWVSGLIKAISDEIKLLADAQPDRFQSNVAQALQLPKKNQSGAPKTTQQKQKTPEPSEDQRSSLQKLVDKFAR